MGVEILKAKHKKAEEDLADMLIRQAHLEQRIARHQLFIAGLEEMIEKASLSAKRKKSSSKRSETSPGLTKMCLGVLKAAYGPMTPSDVVDGLKKLRFNIEKYADPVAVVTTTLKRLVDSKEAKLGEKDGKNVYTWNPYKL